MKIEDNINQVIGYEVSNGIIYRDKDEAIKQEFINLKNKTSINFVKFKGIANRKNLIWDDKKVLDIDKKEFEDRINISKIIRYYEMPQRKKGYFKSVVELTNGEYYTKMTVDEIDNLIGI